MIFSKRKRAWQGQLHWLRPDCASKKPSGLIVHLGGYVSDYSFNVIASITTHLKQDS
jgi:hypothetical protein